MSKHKKIRNDKTCQNCGFFIEKNYCPKCGQENSDSRHSFHHLFTHFVSDYLHYDSSFWKSIKCMLIHPGRLSKEYMKGKRKMYVNPFSLYIFISFLAFFLPSLLPEVPKQVNKTGSGETITVSEILDEINDKDDSEYIVKDSISSKSLASDSITNKKKKKGNTIITNNLSRDNLFYGSLQNIEKNLSDEQRKEKAVEFITHNIPKALFIYMPLFAFLLWLFHSKKKYYYFDSGVFTLHFLSVVLLVYTLGRILGCIADWLNWSWLTVFTWLFAVLYITFYFFRGSRIFYAEKRWIANLKSSFLVVINFFLILFVLILYVMFSFYKVYSS